MAKNTKSNHRKGSVKDRDQVLNPKNNCYVKRNTKTGQFMKVKKTPFKGVRKKSTPKEKVAKKKTSPKKKT